MSENYTVTNKRETYRRAIWNEWKWPAFSSARDRLIKIAETLISAPFIFPVIGKIWNYNVAMDYMLRGVISVVIGAIVVFVVHATVGLAAAMRKVFYAQQHTVIALQSNAATHSVDYEPLVAVRNEQDAGMVRLKTAQELIRTKQDLAAISRSAHDAGRKGGPNREVQEARAASLVTLTEQCRNRVRKCDEPTAEIGVPLGTEGIDSITNHAQLVEYIERKIEMIDAILKTL
jgi:hypothetical protein